MRHSLLSVPVAEAMPAAVHAEARTFHTPWVTAPLIDDVNHTLFAVLRAELCLLAGSFAIRWRCRAARLLAAPTSVLSIASGDRRR